MKKFAAQLSMLSLMLFMVLTSCQPESISTAGDETIPEAREVVSTAPAPIIEIDENTPIAKNQYGEVIINISQKNDLDLRIVFPDVPTYNDIIKNGPVKYDLANFKFAVNRAEVHGLDIESHIGTETYADLAATIAEGDLPFPMSSGNVMGRGVPADQSIMTPVIDVIYDPVATGDPVVDDQTDSNCPYVFGCSGDCAFAIKIDGTWYLAQGDCRRAYLVVCYCHTTKLTPSAAPIGVAVGVGG